MDVTITGFNSLDFDEAQRIAELVRFDIMVHARKIKCCGPGCDYYAKDKRFFITMLEKHISLLAETGATLPLEVREWHALARETVQEFREQELRHLRIRSGKKITP